MRYYIKNMNSKNNFLFAHKYKVIVGTILMLFVLAVAPVVSMADKKEKKDKCNKTYDKDCDGSKNQDYYDKTCNCTSGDADVDDRDDRVGGTGTLSGDGGGKWTP